MSELVAASFPGDMPDTKAREAIDGLQAGGASVYAWALISRDRTGRIAVVDRMEKGAHTGLVAALIGALAGIPAGPLGAIAGAVSGALVGFIRRIGRRTVGARVSGQAFPAFGRRQNGPGRGHLAGRCPGFR